MESFASRIAIGWAGIAGGGNRWQIGRWRQLLPRIDAFEPELQALNDTELRKRSLSLRYRARSRESLHQLLPEAFAVVREAGRRTIGLRHFDTQMLGGMAMHNRSIAEMQTGEGKTLTATLPMYLNALVGRGAHLATVNDYLARRDAEWMRPVYESLGISVGVIETEMNSEQRRKAYACDVTYGTAKEFGFDFLRDRLLMRQQREQAIDFLGSMLGQAAPGGGDQPVQRECHFVLVDEADSVLIDDAGTPLVIGALPTDEERLAAECFVWAAGVAHQFTDPEHYTWEHDKQKSELTQAGRQLARSLPKPPALLPVGTATIYEYVERAIKVNRAFTLDRHYVNRDGEIQIVDEFTGRISEGRKWRDGIHQAVEAKEGVKVTAGGGQAARITVQDFFLRYKGLAGMTGTAITSARELARIYRLQVFSIPTNRPAIRERWPDRIFGVEDDKWRAIVEEVREVHATGRPILIGTRSIDKSERLSQLLTEAGLHHVVLNANKVALEAEIVSVAGQQGKITVSTNMAGRGTDIKLGEGVHELGGLHVICTEMHDSARIDRQLIGRCGRQGDPGTYRQYLALDDDILLASFGPKKADRLKARGVNSSGSFDSYAGTFRTAQQKIERQKFRQRRILMYFEKERHKAHIQMGQDPYLDAPG